MTEEDIIDDIEEDYETKYKNGARQDPNGPGIIPVGRLLYMCSYEEMQERERHGRLNKYEVVPNSDPPRVDFNRAIKEFKRSCVGRDFVHSTDLRPWGVLRKTLHHLLLNICFQDDDWMFICDFVFDRLKAVRQDMVIQRIEGLRYIEVLEGSVRFLLYSMYKLTCTLKDYSKDKPLKVVIPPEGQVTGLNNYEMHVVREMKLTMQCLRDCLNSLLLQYQERCPDSSNRALFESVNLIVNLPFVHGYRVNVTDYQSDKKLRDACPIFKTVFKMYREHLAGNHWTALKLLPKLFKQPLLVVAYAPALAQLQIHLVQLMKKLYAASGSNASSIQQFCDIVCPDWLESSQNERVTFGRFMAVQFDLYDDKRDVIDYTTKKKSTFAPPRNFVEKARLERLRKAKLEGDHNETRSYAMQMISGKDWSFYRESIDAYGLDHILNPQ